MNIYIRALSTVIEFLGKKKFYFVIFFGILTSSIVLAETLMASRVVAIIETFIKDGDIPASKFLWYNIQWGMIILFSIIFQYIYRYFLADKTILDFYVYHLKSTANKALSIPYGKYLHKKSGAILKKIEKSREAFMNFLFFFYLNIIKDLSGVLIAIAILCYIDISMALITISGLPIALFIGIFYNTKTLELQNINNQKEDVIFSVISDSLSNYGLLKILGLEKKIRNDFNTTEDELLEIQYSISKRWAVANIYVGVLVAIIRILVLSVGFYFMQENRLSFSELFLFFIMIGWIYFPLGAIFSQLRQVQRWGASLKEYYEEFVDSYIKEELEIGKSLKNITGNIAFQNVSFGYNSEKSILKNIDFEIKSGEKIALVGNTGAGKSTIVNLLLRFWEVSQGNILLDGNNISSLKKSSLRNHIGVVSQDNSLFNLSIEENLKFANPKATKQQVKEALIAAEAQFVFDLPEGIDTVIGERGLKLSGGEKQRISIARLFLKNPQILILDEATSALDNTTEKKIEKALKKLMKDKTSIIIAHRLSTIQHVDRIFVLEHGKIVEVGNYNELIEKKGKFWTLANPDKLILG